MREGEIERERLHLNEMRNLVFYNDGNGRKIIILNLQSHTLYSRFTLNIALPSLNNKFENAIEKISFFRALNELANLVLRDFHIFILNWLYIIQYLGATGERVSVSLRKIQCEMLRTFLHTIIFISYVLIFFLFS